jgi:hypothetical protein
VQVFTGLLKYLELTAQQRRRHLTVLALHDPRVDYMLVVFQKDKADSPLAANCDLSVGARKIGTGMMPGSCEPRRSSIQHATACSQGIRSAH